MNPYRKLLEAHLGRDDFSPITQKLGMRLVTWEQGRAVMEMQVDESMHNPMGTLHGGITCDLADAAFGCAVASVLEPDEQFTTLELHASYFRAVRDGTLTAEATVVRRGRSTCYLECEIRAEETLTAKLASTCLILPLERSASSM